MKARRVLIAALLLVSAGGLTACGGSKKDAVTTAISPAPTPPGQSRTTTADIRAARRSSVDFKIFPLHVSSIRCQIPRGGPYVPGKMRLDGSCATQLLTYHPPKGIKGGHGTIGMVEVAFTERWHYPAGNRRWWHSTYIVLVRHGHVLKRDTHRTGATPPQSWI
jgi:hypothetical protein